MKTLIFISALVLLNIAAYSQSCFGIEAGFNKGNLNVDMSPDTDTRYGFHCGIFIEAEASENASFQIGVNYTQRGSEFINKVVTLKHQINYIEYPFILNIKFPAGKVVPFISFGVYGATMVSSMQKEEYNSGEYYEYNSWDNYIGGDFGYIAGIGINYKLSKAFQTFTSVNYTRGFNDITEDQRFFELSVVNYGVKYGAGVKLNF